MLIDHGHRKTTDEEFPTAATAADVVVTSYGTLARNAARYRQLRWGRVVLDEAQNIKNPNTSQSQAARTLPAGHRLALTGTPVENRLSELHSIMDFCNPGILGSAASFQHRLAVPVERHDDADAMDRLRRLVEPFYLRRVKTDAAVGLNLPEKTELIDLVPLTEEQAALYQAYTADLNARIEQARGRGRSGIILGALIRFKQICNHPAHFIGDGSGLLQNGRHRSKKVERLSEIVTQARRDDRKVLVFTQFPSFGEMLAPHLADLVGTEVPMLHGGLTSVSAPRWSMPSRPTRSTGDDPVDPGWRHRHHPDPRQCGGARRPLVEPGGRGPGDRPCLPHRPGARGHRPQAGHHRYDRREDQ